MNTNNFSIQGSLDGNYLNISLDENISFDEIALKVMEQDTPEFFLPFKVVDINDSISLKYRLVNNIALKYADTQMSKKTFLKLFLGLVKPFIECKDWMLNYRNICIDPEYIYLDKSSGTAKFVYIPEYSYTNEDAEIFNFLKTTFTSKSITDDPAFQVKMFQFFMRDDVTLIELYNILKEEKSSGSNAMPVVNTTPQPVQPQVVTPAPAPVAPAAPLPEVKKYVQPEPEKKKESIFAKKQEEPASEKKPDNKKNKKDDFDDLFGDFLGGNSSSSGDDLFGDIFDSSSKKQSKNEAKENKNEKQEKKSLGFGGLFGGKKNKEPAAKTPIQPVSTPAQPVQPVQQPSSLGINSMSGMGMQSAMGMSTDVSDSGKTEIFYDNAFQEKGRPHLSFVSSPIEVALKVIYLDIKDDYFVIGRVSNDPVQADVCFSGAFKRIGRKHARVQREDGKFYLIDLGSQNKTLFNGEEMIPNKKYELRSGDEISFTNSLPVKYRVVL